MLLSADQIDQNVVGVRRQLERFLDFGSGPHAARIANNADWLGRIDLLSFLRDEQPEALPRHRAEVALSASARAAMQAAAPDASAARTTKRIAGE